MPLNTLQCTGWPLGQRMIQPSRSTALQRALHQSRALWTLPNPRLVRVRLAKGLCLALQSLVCCCLTKCRHQVMLRH